MLGMKLREAQWTQADAARDSSHKQGHALRTSKEARDALFEDSHLLEQVKLPLIVIQYFPILFRR